MLLIVVIYTSVSILVLTSARRNLIEQLKHFHLSIAEKLTVNASDSIVSGDYGFLMEQIRQLKSSGQIKGVKIIDRRGIIIASDSFGNIGQSDKGLFERMNNTKKEISETDLFLPVEIDKDLLGFLKVSFDWESEREALDREFRKTEIQLIYLALIILAIGIGGSFVVSLILTRPITTLSKEIEDFEREIHSGSGNLIDPSDRDETVQLKHAFHRMVGNLRNYLEEFKKMSEDRVKLVCMATVGQMSAQIAHEIRNSLYAIRSAISGIERKSNSSAIQEYVDIIKDETLEMTMMADEFLRFAKVPSPIPAPCNIDDIVKRVTELLEPDLTESRVKVIIEDNKSIPEIMGDPALLKQVFMNLFLNAIQAMKEGGDIIVNYRTNEGQLEIGVKDTGPGIPEEIASMVFQPFFTTRSEGSGLGLATAYKIILAHHGDIKLIESKRGAHFLITLPLQNNKIGFKNEIPTQREQKV